MKEIKGFEVVHLKPNAQNLEMWIAYDIESKTSIGHIFMTIENNPIYSYNSSPSPSGILISKVAINQ
jgi:hypothetical protein